VPSTSLRPECVSTSVRAKGSHAHASGTASAAGGGRSARPTSTVVRQGDERTATPGPRPMRPGPGARAGRRPRAACSPGIGWRAWSRKQDQRRRLRLRGRPQPTSAQYSIGGNISTTGFSTDGRHQPAGGRPGPDGQGGLPRQGRLLDRPAMWPLQDGADRPTCAPRIAAVRQSVIDEDQTNLDFVAQAAAGGGAAPQTQTRPPRPDGRGPGRPARPSTRVGRGPPALDMLVGNAPAGWSAPDFGPLAT